MKLDRLNGASSVQKVMKAYNTNATKNIQKVSLKEDKIEISQKGKDYQIAMEALKNLPEVREDKVNELMNQIQNGTYNIDKDKLANAIVKGI